jgi:hypothetical protein
MAVLKMVMA